MRDRYPKDIEDYIDESIEDISLRCFDWKIAIYTLCEDPKKVLETKWLRARYLQRGAL